MNADKLIDIKPVISSINLIIWHGANVNIGTSPFVASDNRKLLFHYYYVDIKESF